MCGSPQVNAQEQFLVRDVYAEANQGGKDTIPIEKPFVVAVAYPETEV